MSFQWTFIASYLYLEVAIIVLLITPIISSFRWFRSIFKSPKFREFCAKTTLYFYAWTGLLSLLLYDAIQEILKNLHSGESLKGNANLAIQIKLFRAQRNFYITTFAIFLSFVIRRLTRIIIVQMDVEERGEALLTESVQQLREASTTFNPVTNQYVDSAVLYATLKHELECAQNLLKEQQSHAADLNREITMWKQKYEELTNEKQGRGDN